MRRGLTRLGLIAAAIGGVVAGCQFQVHGLDPTGSVGATPPASNTPQGSPPPAASTPPPTDDAGVVASTDMATVAVGAPCNGNGQCGNAGLICAQSFFDGKRFIAIPGGYCTLDCSNGNACPSGSSCASFSFGHYCLADCPSAPTMCRMGYKCCTQPGVQGCSIDPLCMPAPPEG